MNRKYLELASKHGFISEYITQWLLVCHAYAILQNERASTHMRVYDIVSCLMAGFSTSFPGI